ncbi:MAG: formate/nitrite transporter family protein [Candidatus Omnitrophota bacterium]
MAEEKVQVTVDCKTPANVADALANSICVKKTNASIVKLLILGFFAGAYIAFGAALATLVGHDAAKFVGVGLAKFVIGGVFSVGLMLVVVAGAELFTGNNLMVISALGKKVSFSRVAYKWAIVYMANFIGAVFLAWLMFQTNLWKTNAGEVGAFAVKIANAKVNLTFNEAFFRGIGCNWLVCLAVWMAIASRDVIGKIGAIFFPIMAFVALGFEHSVANMYFIPLGIFLKGTASAAATGLDLSNLTWSAFAITNLVPVTLGNVVGGAVFVASLYWIVYVKPEKA